MKIDNAESKIYRGKVFKTDDPGELGRIKVKLLGFAELADITPWCVPCASLAGPSYGQFFIPQIGDEVFVGLTADGQWFYMGSHWSGNNPKPDDGAPDVQVLRLKGGQQLKFDSAGNIEIDCPGDVKVKGDSSLVVSKECICNYTGGPHPQGVTTVKIKGV